MLVLFNQVTQCSSSMIFSLFIVSSMKKVQRPFQAKELWIARNCTCPEHSVCEPLYIHLFLHKTDCYDFNDDGQTFPKFSKSKFVMSVQYLKKEVRDKVDFSHDDEHQSLLLFDFSSLFIKVSYKVILSLLMGIVDSQSTQSNKCEISLQYLKKEVRNGVHHQSFYS